MSYDELLDSFSLNLVELVYSFIFTFYSDQQQRKFILDRLSKHDSDPTESFFQVSILANSNWSDKNNISKKIMIQYPTPKLSDFLSTNLPNKEISFFQNINAGIFIFGAEGKDSFRKDWISSPVNIYLDNYLISTAPITNETYELFDPSHKNNRLSPSNDFALHPVVNVNWYEATMFTLWLSQTIDTISLPTEYEWEKAASWCEQNKKTIFPWGDCWEKNYCNSWYDGNKSSTSRVGYFEAGKSAYGLYDACGNVWEWCSDWFSDAWSKYFTKNVTSNPSGPIIGNRKVNRGGGWYEDVGMPTVYMRAGDSLMDRFTHCGFRIVKKER